MKVFSRSDILEIIAEADKSSVQNSRELSPTVGSGDKKKVIIGSGLKIKHKPTGLVYTVLNILNDIKGISVHCVSGSGRHLVVTPKHFKFYERE
jgi:hypothetical protein